MSEHENTNEQSIFQHGRPVQHGLYDPALEKDSCGVGFIANIKGVESHAIVRDALTMLQHMDHRGACGCEVNTGDGAGILTALPHAFLAKVAQRDAKLTLPKPGRYAAGIVFLPSDAAQREQCKQKVAGLIAEHGQKLVGWRTVPTNNSDLGPTARSTEPVMEMLFVAAGDGVDRDAFDRKLYVIRKIATRELRGSDLPQASYFYVCSLSTKVIVYKGQLTSKQLSDYFPDLGDSDYVSHLAKVHSRFSTNTFPSWDRAQPCRYMSHNGEINTLRGNINWMTARQGMMQSPLFGDDLAKVFPIVEPDCSDSGNFDNALEMLILAGRSLPEAVMMMIPEAWENHESMSVPKRAFYEYHANLQEPWDGPASVVFTDGKYIGAVLDRNGLRPSRYYVTDDDLVIMASEVGVIDVPAQKVKSKGRLEPGKMFLVDFEQQRIIDDEELKADVASRRPYGLWLQNQRMNLSELKLKTKPRDFHPDTLLPRLQAFGYTSEHMDLVLLPMVRGSQEPVGSMGNDAPLAVLSDKPRLLYDYFKQMFAQVTNPPIDSIREEIIMSLECAIGPEGNLLETSERQCHRLLIPHPILTNDQCSALRQINRRGWKSRLIDITYPREEGEAGLESALSRISAEAEAAIDGAFSLIILTDEKVGADRVPVSSLLAVGTVHHHLVRTAKRTRVGIIIKTGEAREIHHHCLLVGYGADAINPYLAFESLWQAQREGVLPPDISDDEIVKNYIKAVDKGMLKVMAKMGISTLASYKGAQIFEAVGLNRQVIDRCFAGTSSRIQGVGFEVLAKESLRRHEIGYPRRAIVREPTLPNPGEYAWRAEGERHQHNPQTIAMLQQAARANNGDAYHQFAKIVNNQNRSLSTLRGLLNLRPGKAIAIEEVEPAAEIVKRFRSGAMSLGSLSKEAHETLAIAMNRIGGKSNSGEGGEDPVRFRLMPSGDSKRSAIKQVASGRFGVTSWYLTNAETLQIKIAQGAKPGEGGQLPGFKVDQYIAKIRYATPGVGLISPPPHHDIYSIEDLAQLIFDLKNANPAAQISVKLVSEVGVGTIAAGVAKAKAEHILISGHDGGTGASPLTSIKHAGLPWELGIAETHQTLVLNDLRSRVRLEIDGQLKTGRDVVIGALLGAEEFGFSTAPLITLGCIMMRKCHLNTCPVGVATQDPVLRKKFTGQPEHVINYLFMVAEEARELMAQMGFRTMDEMIGRVDMLETQDAIKHWKADGLDLTPILQQAVKPRPEVQVRGMIRQDHGLDAVLDNELIRLAEPALIRREKVTHELSIRNTDRAVGTMLSYHVSKNFGEWGLPEDTIHMKFNGSAGQSFGAWLAGGVTLELEGDANDYIGKGLSGGTIVVYPPRVSSFKAEDNIVIGNVALYGATEGYAFFRGVAGERFCVRNSGAYAVVEGIGDHGCEYMTGGRTVILGRTGRNFAAGMSGGIAYVWDPAGEFFTRCNLATVDLEKMTNSEDVNELRDMITQHERHTGSEVAAAILNDFDRTVMQFVKVMPVDYKRALEERMKHDEESEAKLHGGV